MTGMPLGETGAVLPPQKTAGAEVGGEVWIRIGDQALRFRAETGDVRLFLHDNHAPFRIDPDPAGPDCDVRWAIEDIHPSGGPVVHQFQTRWEIRNLPNGFEEITFYNAVGDDPALRPTLQMVSDPEFRSVAVRQAPREGGDGIAYVSEYPWAEYILQRRLGLHGGAILHASMAVRRGVAHIFLGHSGAGKSTIAELAEQIGATIPTDDRTIVTRSPGGMMAWGTPWHGSFRRTSPDGAPVASISLLVQAPGDRLDRVSPGRGVKEMFVRTVQARVTEREVQNTLDTLEQLAAAAPLFELHFRPTVAAVELVFATVDAASAGVAKGDVPSPQGLARDE